MAVLLLPQLGAQRCRLGIQAAQLGLLLGPLEVPGMGGVAAVVTLDLQQFDFPAQRRQFRLLDGIGLAQVTDLIAAGIQLCAEPLRRQPGTAQALVQQHQLRLGGTRPALQLPGQRQQRHRRARQTEQETGQIQRHKDSQGANEL